MNKRLNKVLSIVLICGMVLGQSTVFATEIPARSEVGDEYKWDLTDLYEDRAAFEKDVELLETKYLPLLASYEGKLNTAENIKAYLEANSEADIILTNVYMYPNLKADLNQDDSEATEMVGIAMGAYGDYLGATSFAIPEILELDESTIRGFMALPEMATYKHFFDTLLKDKAHILSAEEERILALSAELSGTPKDIYDKVTLADYIKPVMMDENGETITLTSSVYYDIIENADRETRKRAYEARYGSYETINNTLAATLTAEIKKNIFNAKARGFDSALDASLAGEYIPRSIYDNLVTSVNDNLGYLHKYYKVRKEAMGLDELYAYDAYVPLVDDYTIEMTFDEANDVIMKALAPLGEQYLKDYETGINSNWIDVYEDDYKYTGGYNWGNYSTHPYILLNYDNSLDSALTLAHEMGHALNSVYSDRTQEYFNTNYPIFTAEVASTVNELLVMDYLINNAETDDEKLYLLNKQIDNIKGTVYTQVMFAEFEQAIHEKVESGEALSADVINDLWLDVLKKYNGPAYVVSDVAKAGWGRIPHFYMNFYVYKYATSMSAANQIVNNILSGDEEAVEKYLAFLGAGGSDYPVEILKEAGVDMNSSEPVDNLLEYFGELVDEFERLLDKKAAEEKAAA